MVTLTVDDQTVEFTDRQYALIADSVALAIETLAKSSGGTGVYFIPEAIKVQRLLPPHVDQQR